MSFLSWTPSYHSDNRGAAKSTAVAAEFNVLGPLEIRHDGTALELGGTRRRELIAALLLRANEVVTAEALLDALCGDPNATNALQANVSRLRRDLGPVAERLQTLPGGYRLEVRDGELDAQRFERALGAARGAEPALARQTLEAALGLWRGPVLGELGLEEFAQSEVRRLEELRLSALVERIEAELALGVPAIGELEALVAEHPLRERLRGQLMLALSLAGRHADALARRIARAVPRSTSSGWSPPRAAPARAGDPHARPAARDRARAADADDRP
jgi:DNA-binding SARP family transcriptional activator